jgi:spore germination cell wall hydrolase CwlJ-like protein
MEISKYSDLDIVAATVCAEAGGEPFAGQVMVGETIANRAIRSGASPRAVCLVPRQFSCWNNRGTMELRMQTMRKHPAWGDCLKIAESICQPGYKPVSPVTHYYAFKKIAAPVWARRMEVVAVVGGHRFYREAA